MSAETWRAKYYPKPASAFVEEGNPEFLDMKGALEHSLRKWEGLREGNMEEECVDAVSTGIYEDATGAVVVRVTMEYCALCLVAEHINGECNATMCGHCPIHKALGMACDDLHSGDISPWHTFLHSRDPEPMIDALIKARDFV